MYVRIMNYALLCLWKTGFPLQFAVVPGVPLCLRSDLELSGHGVEGAPCPLLTVTSYTILPMDTAWCGVPERENKAWIFK